jgi:hypothetical protein
MNSKISTAELIALTAFTRPYLYQLESAGVIRRDGRDTWPQAAITAIVTHLRHENRRGRRSEASDKLASVRAAQLEQRIKREANELIPMTEVVEVLKAICGGIVARLTGLPSRFSRDLNERSRLEAMLNGIRVEIADLLESEAERLGGDHNGFIFSAPSEAPSTNDRA